MSCYIPTREEYIENIIADKKRRSINITVGVIKRAELEAEEAIKRGEVLNPTNAKQYDKGLTHQQGANDPYDANAQHNRV